MKNELTKRIISSIVLIIFSIFVIVQGGLYFNFFILIILIISLKEWLKLSKKLIIKYLGIFFLGFAFYSIYKIRNDISDGYINLSYVLLICISTDIGGFVFGKILKGPKLTKISPNKTYTGLLGSYFLSLISIYFCLAQFNFYIESSLTKILFITFLISTISQLGDLLISYFKRLSNLKDTGNIIPGHGGFLDRIDGMIFAFPFYYIILSLNLFKI